ncbi:hypothetical protein CYMTET_43458 [Cymbomonas tetramitiformis]|uniref:Uncharacterized protein n=1 Tax=Cymbomonas tetramitiformis TaxID=36881 RepID=A0AAE0C389_9CHLO|nr:hypothetical protein CYMTET_43458 [Cymbomonas tetramitiformis]
MGGRIVESPHPVDSRRVHITRLRKGVYLRTRLDDSGIPASAIRVQDAAGGVCVFTAQRMVFWVDNITRDYWIFPYSDQDGLRSVFHLAADLFATPFDVNLKSTVFFTPYPEDTAFAAGLDAHSY